MAGVVINKQDWWVLKICRVPFGSCSDKTPPAKKFKTPRLSTDTTDDFICDGSVHGQYHRRYEQRPYHRSVHGQYHRRYEQRPYHRSVHGQYHRRYGQRPYHRSVHGQYHRRYGQRPYHRSIQTVLTVTFRLLRSIQRVAY